MTRPLSLVIVAGLAGCTTGTQGDFLGEDLHDVFPFDQIRHWTYQTADTTVRYRLVADQLPDSEVVGSARVFTITFITNCFSSEDPDCTELEVVDTWKMSSDPTGGVLVYEMGGTVYDPPVLLADDPQRFQEGKTSTSGGVTFTSTYAARESCPAPKYWTDESIRPECVHIDLTDDGAGTTIAGKYWAVGNFGLVAYQHDIDGIAWGLKDFSSEPF